MKRITFVAVLVCLILCPVMAQTQMEQYIGLQFGYTMPLLRLNSPFNSNKKQLDTEKYNGVKVGVVYDVTLVKGFGIYSALNYTYGASHTDWTNQYTTALYPKIRTRSQYHQIELAVDFQYKVEIARSTYLIFYTGPTFQCGLKMEDKWYVKLDEETEQIDKTINYYDTWTDAERTIYNAAGEYELRRFNMTWGVGGGFQYKNYFLRGGYDFGLINPYIASSFTGYDCYTRGRFDQWAIRIGAYIWDF